MKPIRETNASGLELAYVHQDQNFDTPFVTFILKGTFDIVPDDICVAVKKQRAVSGDARHMDEIGRSLAWASDLVPFKPHSDFLIHGSFHAPGGIAMPQARAWFIFGPLRKELLIIGPRSAVQMKGRIPVVTPPTPIASLPLRWEYSAGGLRDRRNPIGMGQDPQPGPDGERIYALPMIEDPARPITALSDRPDPVNVAPIPPFFQARQRRLGTRDHRWALFRAPLPPIDFDPSYYNAAPRDQQGGNYPRGDEMIILGNMHPKHPILTTRLPGIAARVAVLRQQDGVMTAEAVPMNLDTVVALPDEDQVVLAWRGRCPVRDRKSEDELVWVAAATEPLAGPPLSPPLQHRLMQAWYDEQAAAAAQAKQEADAVAAQQAAERAHVAQTMASVKKLLGSATFPPELTKIIETENDPEKLIQHLTAFVENTIAELSRRFPHLADPPDE